MVFEKVKKIIADQLDIDADGITYESNLADDFGADSLDLVDISMSIEDEFGVEFPEDALENISTVADLVKFIEDNQ